MLLKRIVLLILFLASTGSTVWAQTPQGLTSKFDPKHLSTTEVLPARVRQSDSLLNGALIGAGVAVASGLFVCTRMEPWRNCRDDYGPMLRLGAIGAGIGIGIDALLFDRKTTHQPGPAPTRLRATPMIGRRAAGLHMSVDF